MRHLFLLLSLALITGPAYSDHWYNEMLNDYEKLGSVISHSDDSDMQMTFVLRAPFWLANDGVKGALDSMPAFPLDKEDVTENSAHYLTAWKVVESGFATKVFSGTDRQRVRMRWRLTELSPQQTQIIGSFDFQIQNEDAFDDDWNDRSDRELRQIIRQVMSSIATYCRYPNDRGLRARIYTDYQEGRRHGKKGFELDPVQTAAKPVEPPAEATKTCPFCAETIKLAAVKCKHCKEFLDTVNAVEGAETGESLGTSPTP